MTFDDDFVMINFQHGTVRQFCKALHIDWPPPEKMQMFGFTLKRERMSRITDGQRETMTHVCRGAEYSVTEQMK